MAIREIREKGDEILYKKCKAVVKFDEKLHILLDDMYETMQSRDGVGLAAPQVGILKRAVVIDVGDGKIELINPEIVEEMRRTDLAAKAVLAYPECSARLQDRMS